MNKLFRNLFLVISLLLLVFGMTACTPVDGSIENLESNAVKATQSVNGQWVEYYVSRSGSKWVGFSATAGQTYTISWTDKYGYYDWRPYPVLDVFVEDDAGTKVTNTVYNTNGITPLNVTAQYTETYWIYLKEIGRDSGYFEVKIEGGNPDPDPDPDPTEPTPPSSLIRYKKGGSNVEKTTSFGVCLTGGGAEVDGAMQWMINKSGNGDFVVLRRDDPNEEYEDRDGNMVYPDEVNDDNSLTNYLWGLGTLNSVTTLVIMTQTEANSDYVDYVIRNAEAIWIVGGNQTGYYDTWNGTKVDTAIEYAVNTKGVPIGGTSAGMHSMGKYLHTPSEGDSVISPMVLADPYVEDNEHEYYDYTNDPADEGYYAAAFNFSDNFLNIPLMANIVTDTHWSERNRLGRTIGMLARMIQDGNRTAAQARAIACDESTAVTIEANGSAKIWGTTGVISQKTGIAFEDYAYFFKADTAPNRCVNDQTLNWTDAVTVYKVAGYADGRNTFNVGSWTGTGGQTLSVNVTNGNLSQDIQTPN
jgi:cyanophycinase-like exopeptidase